MNRLEYKINSSVSEDMTAKDKSQILGVVGELNHVDKMNSNFKFGSSIHLQPDGTYAVVINTNEDGPQRLTMTKEQLKLFILVAKRVEELEDFLS